MGIPDYFTCLLRNLYAGQEALEQQTDCNLGKVYVKAVYCHSAYLTYMQSPSCEMPGWIPAQAGIKIARIINNLRYAGDTTLMAERKGELKSLLMKLTEASEEVGLKLRIQKLRSWHLLPSLCGKQTGTMETVTGFIFLGSKEVTALTDSDCSHEIKRWKKSYDQPRQHIKKQRHYFANKGPCCPSYSCQIQVKVSVL